MGVLTCTSLLLLLLFLLPLLLLHLLLPFHQKVAYLYESKINVPSVKEVRDGWLEHPGGRPLSTVHCTVVSGHGLTFTGGGCRAEMQEAVLARLTITSFFMHNSYTTFSWLRIVYPN